MQTNTHEARGWVAVHETCTWCWQLPSSTIASGLLQSRSVSMIGLNARKTRRSHICLSCQPGRHRSTKPWYTSTNICTASPSDGNASHDLGPAHWAQPGVHLHACIRTCLTGTQVATGPEDHTCFGFPAHHTVHRVICCTPFILAPSSSMSG